MAPLMKHLSVSILIMVMLAMVEATPPGIANNPSHSSCKNPEYKECVNKIHVCPKFCPNSCTTDCRSCKPICSGGPTVPNDPDSDSPSHPTPYPDPKSPPKTPSPPPYTPNPSTPSPTPPTPSTPSPTPPTPSTSSPTPPTPSPTPPTPSTPSPTPPTPSRPSPTPPTPSTPSPTPPTPSTPTPTPPTPSTPSPTPPTPSTPSPTPPTPSTPTPTPPTPSTPSSTPPTTPTPPSSSPTPPSTPTPYHPPSTSGKKRKRCKNRKYGQCYNVEHICPNACPTDCQVDCVSCKPVCNCDMPGAVCQDPRFIGGDGITFYFHGKKDQDFCLVSDSNIHINGHFIGKRNPKLTRDYTWVQSVGILFDTHKLYLGAQRTAIWNDQIDRLALAFDGEPIFLPNKQGATWVSEIAPSVSVTRIGDTNSVVVEVEGNFQDYCKGKAGSQVTTRAVPITEEDSRVHNYGITKDDSFAHLDMGFKFYSLSDRVNGVLGQTYGANYVSNIKVGVTMPVMGRDREFSSSTLFSTDCSVAPFNGGDSPLSLESVSLSCTSGMAGEGVVCKR